MSEELRQAGATRSAARTETTVRILYGIRALEVAVAGRTVAEIRQALAQPLNISPRAVAVVDGEVVAEGHLLQAGQQLDFVRLAGEKGCGRRAGIRAGSAAASGREGRACCRRVSFRGTGRSESSPRPP